MALEKRSYVKYSRFEGLAIQVSACSPIVWSANFDRPVFNLLADSVINACPLPRGQGCSQFGILGLCEATEHRKELRPGLWIEGVDLLLVEHYLSSPLRRQR